eukprot:Phypoly_transcript_14101.p1 GENE.Phypoly_transcript_14101~~Phypoly_transcript_14101.p1  ORF type:complete len:257 (+),score=12.20 Phypoly_transcript_14101:83-853(+)
MDPKSHIKWDEVEKEECHRGGYQKGRGVWKIPKYELRLAFGCLIGETEVRRDFKDCVLISIFNPCPLVEHEEKNEALCSFMRVWDLPVDVRCLAWIWRYNMLPIPGSKIGAACKEPRCLKCTTSMSVAESEQTKQCRRVMSADLTTVTVDCPHTFKIGDEIVRCNPNQEEWWLPNGLLLSPTEVYEWLSLCSQEEKNKMCRTPCSDEVFWNQMPDKKTNFCVCMKCGLEWDQTKGWKDFKNNHQHKSVCYSKRTSL